jgi:hypothetical protein
LEFGYMELEIQCQNWCICLCNQFTQHAYIGMRCTCTHATRIHTYIAIQTIIYTYIAIQTIIYTYIAIQTSIHTYIHACLHACIDILGGRGFTHTHTCKECCVSYSIYDLTHVCVCVFLLLCFTIGRLWSPRSEARCCFP